MMRWVLRPLVMLIALASLSAVNVAEAGQVYGVFVSRDGGISWNRADAGLQPGARVNALAMLGSTIVGGTDAGIFVSTNDAKLWHAAVIEGVERVRVTSLATTKDRVWAGTAEGFLFVSADGQKWERNNDFPAGWVRCLHVTGGVIYVGTDADSVYRSSDEGKTWSQLSAGMPAHAQVFALTSIDGQVFAGLYAQGLYSWSDEGRKWNRIGAQAGIKPLALAAVDDVLIAGHNPGGVYWSGDRGERWERWDPVESNGPAPTIDSILNGAAKATDATLLDVIEAPIWEMSGDARTGIAGAGEGIFYSKDGGRRWRRATKGLPENGPGIAFVVRGGIIFAAVHLKGLPCEAAGSK